MDRSKAPTWPAEAGRDGGLSKTLSRLASKLGRIVRHSRSAAPCRGIAPSGPANVRPRTSLVTGLGVACIGALSACQPASAPSAAQTETSATNASASAFDRRATLALAATARDICAEHMPDARLTREAWNAAGLPAVGSDGRYHFHTPDRFDLIAAINTSARTPTCFIAVRNMSDAEARSLIAPWIGTAGAEPAPDLSTPGTEAWRGRFRGAPVTLVIGDDIRLPGLRGRAIGARAL